MFLSISSSVASSVDLLGLNLYCWFDKSLCDVKYSINWLCIAFSNIFEITGRTDIDL